ncbi:hypothetical protein CEK62_02360 [Alcanivorax sp. N3-2A]|nr:hypothetical protein CEK62_02360 [Alcanivorax sp. N3-2A]|tara:strand:- start:104002 stop:104406 length:405 start_codon:yes stop_codon:yes gene_type:complete
MLTPHYAQGRGQPPVYLAAIERAGDNRGALVFAVGEAREKVAFGNDAELTGLLRQVLAAPVALSAGGHVPGPVDEVAMRIDAGELSGPYVEIAWSAPGRWILRQQVSGASQWQQSADPAQLVALDFRPATLKSH